MNHMNQMSQVIYLISSMLVLVVKKSRDQDGSLIIRGITTSLRGRVNAMAELLNLDRDSMVISWLENETRALEVIQRELSEAKHVTARRSEMPRR